MERVNNIVVVEPSIFNGLQLHCFEKPTKSLENLQFAHVLLFKSPDIRKGILTECQNPGLWSR